MNENLKEMIKSGQPEVAQEVAANVAPIADNLLEAACTFAKSLSEDVKIVTHGNTWSIKMKNKNFVFITKTKKSSKIQVKNGKVWDTLPAESQEAGVKQAIQTAFNSL